MDIAKMVTDTVIATFYLGGLGGAFATLLYFAYTKLSVKVDPKIELILSHLPGSNCGACGFPGCAGLAEAIAEGKAEVTGCLAGGQATALKLADALGISITAKEDKVAFVACRAGRNTAKTIYTYEGVLNCQAAHLFFGGDKACQYGCLGLGTCVEVCPFDAIKITAEGVALVNPAKCTACQKCVKSCPRNLISMQPKKQKVLVVCKNLDKAKKAREVCSIACIACKICEKNCPEKAIVVVNNLAIIDPEKCTACNICVEKCPQKSIVNISLEKAGKMPVKKETAPV